MKRWAIALVSCLVWSLSSAAVAIEPHGDADITAQQIGQPGITAEAHYGSGEAAVASNPSGKSSSGQSSLTAGAGVAVATEEIDLGAPEIPVAQSSTLDVGEVASAGSLIPCVTFGDWTFELPRCAAPAPEYDPRPGTGGDPGGTHTPAPPSPEELAQVAVDRAMAAAARPALRLAPSRVGLTGLDTFVWLARRPEAIQAVASVPGLTVVAQARPVQYVWDFGDGDSAVTDNPGRPWRSSRPGNIAHLYEVRGLYVVGVEVIWSARWAVADEPWTPLGYFSTSDSDRYPVRQVVSRLVLGS